MKNRNTETAYNFLYLNFKLQNTKKHVFLNVKPEYGNRLQL